MKIHPLLLTLGLACSLAANATQWPPPVTRYLETLATVEAAGSPVTLRPLFDAARAVQDTAMRIEQGQAWLETLDDDAYRRLEQALRGLRLSRGLDVYAAPDPVFLDRLAQRHGTPEDRAFFALYRRSWGPDLLPAYLRQTGRVTPCVRYAENVIPDLYRAWTGFRDTHPQAYPDVTAQFVADLEELVSLGTCACGGQADVEQELRTFVTLFPQSPAAPAVLQRLQQLEEDPDRLPVHCR